MSRRCIVLACLSVGVLIGATPATATDYAALAETAKAGFQPIETAEVDAARARLAERMVAVERLVGPASAAGDGWLGYLRWDGLQQQITPGSAFDAAAARATLTKLSSGAEGLERPEFGAVAEALEDYIAVASFAGVRDQPAVFARQVDRFTELLTDGATIGTARGSYEAERRLRLLHGLGQADALVGAVHAGFGLPNLLVGIDAPTLNRLVGRTVNDCDAITDCILGTSIHGSGLTNASVSVAPLPANGRARLRFTLAGSTRSNTSGQNGPVTIRSAGDTTFHATKIVELSDDAFRVFPAAASATTRSRTLSVKKTGGGIGSGLIERIGKKRVAQKKGQADAIAGRHAEARIAGRLDEQLTEQIFDARRRYDDRLTKPLRRRRATPRSLVYQTTGDGLSVVGVQATASQLAAADAPPEAVGSPINARLHESAANSLIASYLDGATLTRRSEDQPAELDVVLPKWARDRDPEPTPEGVDFRPWSIRFRAGRPVSVEFGEGQLTATIHAARIAVGDEHFDGWDLILRFEPQRVDGQWRLVRRGDVEVLPTRFDPAAGKPMASKNVAMRNNLAKALNEPEGRLPRQIEIDPIDLTQREGPVDFLVLEDLRIADGWLAAGWQAL